ncbi:glutamine-hydrolyzing carbamoyl-phosphate synthase small subunit [Candidatus Fermentibacterales bacterium]|nr:glutamine-hydrolyzing carbamoyl-phosphate synthase small subunit [Candidatus Fermentibacterales bacterium]
MTGEPEANQPGLFLADGSFFRGVPFGAASDCTGEVVFNTGMVGYPESLTDPSYHEQILLLTYPLQGNYGVPGGGTTGPLGIPECFESDRIRVKGLVVSRLCEADCASHHSSSRSLHEWLLEQGVPGLSGVDTRALTRRIRHSGTMPGYMGTASGRPASLRDPNLRDLVAEVSRRDVVSLDPGSSGEHPTVVLVDCGLKAGIARCLLARGMRVLVVPHDHYFPGMDLDGLVISNGPGDPALCSVVARNVGRALALGKPILGICLGHQILALAAGAGTYKLPFGHRGQNQPCLELPGGAGARCYLTSQNHGYAVEESSLPEDWTTWMRNANDGSVEAIRHGTRPFTGVQFHPEASPGPTDTAWIFDMFADQLRGARG